MGKSPLRFEHIGPEDGRTPFVITVGIPASSTGARWLLTQAAYAQIRTQVRRLGSARTPSGEPAGTFAVGGASPVRLILPPAAMKTILQTVRHIYSMDHIAPPALVTVHEALLMAADKQKGPPP